MKPQNQKHTADLDLYRRCQYCAAWDRAELVEDPDGGDHWEGDCYRDGYDTTPERVHEAHDCVRRVPLGRLRSVNDWGGQDV